MQTERDYWFPAKRYGWGWGIPNRWQGWLVLAVFAGLLSPARSCFHPPQRSTLFLRMSPSFADCLSRCAEKIHDLQLNAW